MYICGRPALSLGNENLPQRCTVWRLAMPSSSSCAPASSSAVEPTTRASIGWQPTSVAMVLQWEWREGCFCDDETTTISSRRRWRQVRLLRWPQSKTAAKTSRVRRAKFMAWEASRIVKEPQKAMERIPKTAIHRSGLRHRIPRYLIDCWLSRFSGKVEAFETHCSYNKVI